VDLQDLQDKLFAADEQIQDQQAQLQKQQALNQEQQSQIQEQEAQISSLEQACAERDINIDALQSALQRLETAVSKEKTKPLLDIDLEQGQPTAPILRNSQPDDHLKKAMEMKVKHLEGHSAALTQRLQELEVYCHSECALLIMAAG
jgi:hypothetical protein